MCIGDLRPAEIEKRANSNSRPLTSNLGKTNGHSAKSLYRLAAGEIPSRALLKRLYFFGRDSGGTRPAMR